jgi:hypothetical protein
MFTHMDATPSAFHHYHHYNHTLHTAHYTHTHTRVDRWRPSCASLGHGVGSAREPSGRHARCRFGAQDRPASGTALLLFCLILSAALTMLAALPSSCDPRDFLNFYTDRQRSGSW